MNEDKIVMYLIVNKTLNMSIGKVAAQVGHAVGMLYDLNDSDKIKSFQIWNDWIESDYRKVVLGADESQWSKIKQLENIVVVVDRGLTEIKSGSETVIGLYPLYQSNAPKIIKRLQLLK